MVSSDFLELLVFGGVVLLIVIIVFFQDHRKQLQDLERRMKELERHQKRMEEGAPQVAAPEEERRTSPMERAREAARQEHREAERPASAAVPPPLPPQNPVAPVAPPVSEPVQPAAMEAPQPVAPPEPKEDPLMAWLERVGMKPPKAGEDGANLIAWWSTRAGLGLGVIAAVFFGLYVNQNTVPWVRLVELILLACALFVGGCWLERKQGAFGRALTAGGLGLFYVAAFAAYGLPAMKVIESPVAGAVLQLLAVGLMAGWGLRKNNEGVFALSLVLGYLTSWFSHAEGVEPLPLVSLLVLAAGGNVLFALRGWWSGLAASLMGSSIGMILLAVFSWYNGEGPHDAVGLGAACFPTVLFVAGLYVQRKKFATLVAIALPVVTSAGVLVGAVVTWALDLEWEWYYASFAVLLLVAGCLWRTSKEALWEIMWAKAAVFVALFLIAALDGPVRAYGLLAQAGSLAFLANRKGWVVFDFGALLALLVGWIYMKRELVAGQVSSWEGPEFLALGFLVGALGIVAWFGRGAKLRQQLAFPVLVILALTVFWTAVWRVDHDWTVLAALLGAVVFVGVGRWAGLWRSELLGAVFLVPMLIVLAERGFRWVDGGMDVVEVGWPLIVWLAATWAYCVWLGRDGTLSGRVVGDGLMVLSVGAVLLAGVDFCGREWVVVVLLAVGVVWRLLHGRVSLPDLSLLSMVPALSGAFLLFLAWGGERSSLLLVGALVGAVAYWGHDLLLKPTGESESRRVVLDMGRTLVLGWVLLTSLHLWTSGSWEVIAFGLCSLLMIGIWRQLGDKGTAWIGAVAAVVALGVLLEHRTHDAWHVLSVALLFLFFVSNGLILARSGRGDVLAAPKLASMFWGSASLLAVLIGLVLVGEVAGWTTAGCALGAVLLLTSGFWGGLRGYRVIGLLGIGFAILRLFAVDLDEIFWRIVAFGVTGALLVGIGYIYNRFHRQLAEHDLDWRKGEG